MLLNCDVGEECWESLGLQGDPTSQYWRKSTLNIHWKDSCWSWNSNTLATLCKELIHWKRPWCWERLRAGGEGGDRRWDDRTASLTQWTWVWANFRRWWRTGKPGVLQSMELWRVRHDWVTEQQWGSSEPLSDTVTAEDKMLEAEWRRHHFVWVVVSCQEGFLEEAPSRMSHKG